MRYVDANVLIHAAIDQEPRAGDLSRAFVQRLIEGTEEVFLTEPVVAEVFANLRTARAGRLTHRQIADFLAEIIDLSSVMMADKGIWRRTLEILVAHRVDLADAHQLAMAERDGGGELITFDRRLDRLVAGVRALEPVALRRRS